MNKNQKLFQKIIEYNKRSPLGPNYNDLYTQFQIYNKIISDELLNDVLAKNQTTKVLTRFSYVLYISFLQECVKKWVKCLIDNDYNYLIRLNSKYKMEFDVHQVGHFIEKKVSLGDFVAHNILPNSLEELAKIYNVLLEADLFKAMKKRHEDYSKEEKDDEDFGSYVEAIKKCFSNRHVVAHELSELPEDHQTDHFRIGMGMILLVNSLEIPQEIRDKIIL